MAAVEIKDDRSVQDRIMRELAKLRRTVVTIGVHGDDNARQGASSNAMIGAVHEFGGGNVPERSFLRATVDQDEGIMEFASEQASAVAHGEMTANKAGNRIGLVIVDKVKKRIKTNIPPPLSTKTIERKLAKGAHGGGAASHASTPAVALIDTGQLINSINYKVQQ